MFIPIICIAMWTVWWPIAYTIGIEINMIQRIAQITVPFICLMHSILTLRLRVKGYPLTMLLYIILCLVVTLFFESNLLDAILHYVNYGLIVWVCFSYLTKYDSYQIVRLVFFAIITTFILTVIGELISPSGREYDDISRLSLNWANPIWLGFLSIMVFVSLLGLIQGYKRLEVHKRLRIKNNIIQLIDFFSTNKIMRGTLFFISPLTLLILYATKSIGAAIFGLVILTVIIFFSGLKNGVTYLVLAGVILMILSTTGILNHVIEDYLYRIQVQKNLETRIESYSMAFDFVNGKIWWGFGWTDPFYTSLREMYNFRSEAGWSNMLLELGVIRLFVWTVVFLNILFRFFNISRLSDNMYKKIAAICLASLISNGSEAIYSSLSSPFAYIFMIFWGQLNSYINKFVGKRYCNGKI